jgi:hypothetical protein
MPTKFKLIFESDEPDIDLPRFWKSLPRTLEITEEQDGIYVTVPSNENEDKKRQYLINRELDRHFFLTCVKIKAAMVKRRVTASFTSRYRIHGRLDPDIEPQSWNYDLSVQLRLWALVDEAEDLIVKVILFYLPFGQLGRLTAARRAAPYSWAQKGKTVTDIDMEVGRATETDVEGLLELRRLLPGREGNLFIRRDNTTSLAAHEKMGKHGVASFEFSKAEHAVFSYSG